MKENFDKCFQLVLEDEGKYVNDPRDPGGRTNLGVTQRAWEAFLNRDVTEAEMRSLTPEAVKGFYRTQYWDKIKGDQLPLGVDYAAFDFAVNSGTGRSAKYLQEIAGVTADGVIGPKSIEALVACDYKQIIDSISNMRLDFLKRLPTFKVYGKGWSARVSRVKDKASAMV